MEPPWVPVPKANLGATSHCSLPLSRQQLSRIWGLIVGLVGLSPPGRPEHLVANRSTNTNGVDFPRACGGYWSYNSFAAHFAC